MIQSILAKQEKRRHRDLLKEMSATELEHLIKTASQMMTDLRAEEPTYQLAIAKGIEDNSYPTVANGRVASFHGEVTFTMDNGQTWRAVGHRSSGNAHYAKDGYIEFFKVTD